MPCVTATHRCDLCDELSGVKKNGYWIPVYNGVECIDKEYWQELVDEDEDDFMCINCTSDPEECEEEYMVFTDTENRYYKLAVEEGLITPEENASKVARLFPQPADDDVEDASDAGDDDDEQEVIELYENMNQKPEPKEKFPPSPLKGIFLDTDGAKDIIQKMIDAGFIQAEKSDEAFALIQKKPAQKQKKASPKAQRKTKDIPSVQDTELNFMDWVNYANKENKYTKMLTDLLLIDDMYPVDAERSTENKKYYKKFYSLQREGVTIGNIAIQQDKKSNCIAIHFTAKAIKYWEQHCD
jgi:hypothetical protein